jgi:4-hydroxy-3-polyprenylbenzoate decarboxylase
VLLAREAPLNLAHLRNMTAVAEMGGTIFPPLPAFYQRPQSVTEMVDHTLGRVLEQFGIAHDLAPPWQGWPAADASTVA